MDSQTKNLLFLIAQENLRQGQNNLINNTGGLGNLPFLGLGLGSLGYNNMNALNGLTNNNNSLNYYATLQYQELLRNMQLFDILQKQAMSQVPMSQQQQAEPVHQNQIMCEFPQNPHPPQNHQISQISQISQNLQINNIAQSNSIEKINKIEEQFEEAVNMSLPKVKL
jgi:hypothetical protein